MNGRPSKPTPPRKPAPLIRSKLVLRALVTGVTLTTFTGMSAFAATHIQNAAAPLKPSANGASTTSTTTSTAFATPAPTARNRTTTTGRVPTTQIAPRTRTSSS